MAMSENEAIKRIKELIPYMSQSDEEDLQQIEKALEEVEQYRAMEERLNGISVEQVVNGFINQVEKETHEGYEKGRILTNAEADDWDAYRAIGTVEDWRKLIEKEATERRKLEEYFMLGSVEGFKALKDINRIADNLSKMERIEFKALKEKNEPKKPYIQQIVKDFREHDCYECPNCDCFVGYVSECQEEHYQYIYCPNCGQKLDWQ